jgi:glycerol-3-phosphate dehydrogenase
MIREPDRLTGQTFDVLVVGAGVYGLAIAYDAAQRGLSVAVVERDDFGSGSSFNHLRTIHGGLRYLQTLDIRRARESIRERATLARIAPHAVRRMPFVLPLYRSALTGKAAARVGFLLDQLVAFDRNADVPSGLRIPAGRVISRGDAIQKYPGLRRQGLTGAAVWYDYITPESDRLTFSFALAAQEHGALLVNHVEATTFLQNGDRVTGVRMIDRQADATIDVAARVTVNATGGSCSSLLASLNVPADMPVLTAMNLVTKRDAGDEAIGGRGPSGQHFFLVPWRGRALLGTWESAGPPHSDGSLEGAVEAFIRELNGAFPALELTPPDITLVHRGVVPAIRTARGLKLEGRERVRDHQADRIAGLISVAGTKYTTARGVAERVVDRVMRKLERPAVPCRTASRALPGGSVRDVALTIAEARRDFDTGLPSDAVPHLVAAYGSRYRDILDLAAGQPACRARVAQDSPVIGAELVWAVRREMAVTLPDAVIRRTPIGALGYPGDAAVERAAAIVGSELNWSDEQRLAEIAAVKRFYDGRSFTAP